MLVKLLKDKEANSYSWVYTGGCYNNNETFWYEWAKPDNTYTFNDVQFDIRLDHRLTVTHNDDDDIDTNEEKSENEDEV